MDYGKGFGDQNTLQGTVFKFKDFDLKYQGYKDLTSEEKKLRQASIDAGTDGGSSMLSPSNTFSITEPTGNVKQVQLAILPYSTFRFEVNFHKFELRNFPANGSRWIVLNHF